jgi:hypothetical protein
MSELKIVSFDKSQNNANGDLVIERLEQALEHAKIGGVANCIIVMALNDGSVQDCWANGSKPFVMVGALESIKREFMDACIEGR